MFVTMGVSRLSNCLLYTPVQGPNEDDTPA